MVSPRAGVIGIRREDKNRWERRVPLSPEQVRRLIASGIRVIVQPSNIRCWADNEYLEAGAEVNEDLSEAATVLAVKEVPADLLIPDRTYVFFSHTIKAQPYNMALLDTIIEKNIRLIDYEKITDSNNARLVRFGPWAGVAGTIDILAALGDRLLAKGFSTPFLYCAFARTYRTVGDAQEAIKNVGKIIERVGLPADLCPFVIGITGTGSVATGAKQILELLPHKYITASELPELLKTPEQNRKTVYLCVTTAEDMVVPVDRSKRFDKKEYYAHPELYEPVFHENVMPHLSVIVNCMYWEPRFPRICTKQQVYDLLMQKRLRLIAVSDISCDPEGSIEFFVKTTTISDPLYVYNVNTGGVSSDIEAEGILFLGVDHLPAELPFQSSEFFGESLLPFLPRLARSDSSVPYEDMQKDLPPELFRAVMTCHRSLTPPYQYILELRKKTMKSIRRILVLGSGYVSKGFLEFLCRSSKNRITVASNMLEEAEKLCDEYGPNTCRAVYLNLKDLVGSAELISRHDVVVSLVPAFLHVAVAKLCIQERVHMVTASYISPEMAELDQAAKEAGVSLMNEMGFDPGLDHLSAKKIIDEAHAHGGQVLSFTSFAGGLPAPEFSNNPMGYKFSWSPRGVLVAAEAPAKFLRDGLLVERAAGETYVYACPQRQYRGFNLEGVANRDSIKYKDLYGIPEAQSMLRGTLRYPGFATMVLAFRELGLMTVAEEKLPETWHELLASRLNCAPEQIVAVATERLVKFFKGNMERVNDAISGLKWFGLIGVAAVAAPDGDRIQDRTSTCCLDVLANHLNARLQFETGERDLLILTHEFIISYPSATRKQKITSSLVAYGDPLGQKDSLTAMARLVGVPAAVSALCLLDGTISVRGVFAPLTPEVYLPLIDRLAQAGISMTESVEDVYEE